ncbi:hypothetical protein E2986_13758 [Frieseomelitta varia]|uniref:Uncharacterized protein n=1 Tax=Frieseomelitta varia TaxID=561572 RepID=A0A833S9M0_9HYME|nr:uncharacterized abhydrolase domain-containing protein DDB_G0269086 [Frieseomelitta varia]KAF3427235.1 hypothetical protein E2986_13758 [Frieseomelitta varia]
MKAVCWFLVVLLARQAVGGILRNPPAFSKPVYADSYLPAAMQVIFHAVEQLKLLQSEEDARSSTSTTNTWSSTASQESSTASAIQSSSDESEGEENESNDKTEEPMVQEASKNETEIEEDRQVEEAKDQEVSKMEESHVQEIQKDEAEDQEVSKIGTSESKIQGTEKTKAFTRGKTEGPKTESASSDETETLIAVETSKPDKIGQESMVDTWTRQESPEVNEETPETNYATPETNYEVPEDVHAVQETNHEVPEEDHERISSLRPADSVNLGSIVANSDKKKEPTIDSVVQDVYEILKPTPSKFMDAEPLEESKSAVAVPEERLESMEEEEDENRFTRLGEKVTQVPRPSLNSYLRRSKVRPSATLQQLANLYDSLSKDARKQGFGKYTGYSDEVLNTLETSAEGGIGPQLKKILSKMLEQNELTRDDARMRTSQAIRDLDNPSSVLNKDLRPLLPLRYSP